MGESSASAQPAAAPPGKERSYGANSLFALVAYIVPAAAALITVPVYVRGLGSSAYGLLTLIAAITGYLGLVELGLGQALIRYLSFYRTLDEGRSVMAIIRFAMKWFLLAGSGMAVLLFFIAPWLVDSVFKMPASLHDDAVLALQLSSINIVLGLLLSLGTAMPVSFLRYDLSSSVAVVFGVGSSVGPAIIVSLGHGIVAVVVFFIISNATAVLVYAGIGIHLLRPLNRHNGPGWKQIRRSVLSFAGFVAVGRVSTTVANQTSRVMVGAVVNAAGAAFYQVPNMLAGQLGSLLNRLGQVLFPTGAKLIAQKDYNGLRRLYFRVSRILFLVNASITAALCAFADPLLHYWVNGTYASRGAPALTVFALAQCVSSAAQPVGFLSWSAERAGLNLTFNLCQTGITLAALYPLTRLWGVTGAASSMALGSLVMPVFMHYGHHRILGVSTREVLRRCYLPSIVGASAVGVVAAFTLSRVSDSLAITLLYVVVTVILAAFLSGMLGAVTHADVADVKRLVRRRSHGVPVREAGER